MRLTFASTGTVFDADVTVVDPTVSIGEVMTAITGRPPGPTIRVDGRPVRSVEAIGATPARNGSVVDDRIGEHIADQPALATVTQIAGEGSGQQFELRSGIYDLGRRRPAWRAVVGPGGVTVIPLSGPDLLVVGGRPADDEFPTSAQPIESTDAAFVVTRGPAPVPAPLPLVEGGRVPVQRPPRQLGWDEPARPARPEPPKPPQTAQPFSWIIALAPVPIGIIAALFFSPFFLIFMLMTPILTVGRWFESRRRSAKDRRRHDREVEERASGYRAELERWTEAMAEGRRRWRPDLVTLQAIAFGQRPGLWARRPEHRDFLEVVIGLGDQPLDLDRPEQPSLVEPEREFARLRSVPIVVGLGDQKAIGLVGAVERRQALAAALVTELAITHGPADLSIGLLLDPSRRAAWDWTKWLPHLEDERGFRQVVNDPTTAAALLASLPRPPIARGGEPVGLPIVPVLVVDGREFLHGSFVALSTAVRSGAATAIVLADTIEELPAICSTVVDLGASGRVAATAVDRGARLEGILPTLLDPDRAASIVRHLSAYRDPEQADGSSDLPDRCDLRSLIGGTIDTEVMAERWRGDGHRPSGLVGVATDGALRLDLVADGPHALVAGTTGSGKSELLRTLIAGLAAEHGPDRLNFVLIDFKGGGAFDACGHLPHTVGVVTDLDEHLASRALRCLKAELRHRELLLRDAGVSDLRDYRDAERPLARLVVVVDEFATLAAELPEFMTSLVDVAQRGRSLGIHMILATQRPAGVVDAKIRANTNLRISLRVQDVADSEDVIGDKRAAAIDRRSPGRGYARLGAAELIQFQTALVSEPSATHQATPLRIEPFELTGGPAISTTEDGDRPVGPTDLERLVDAATETAVALGLADPRVPWPAPLPSSIDAGTLGRDARQRRWAAPLGMVDLPDEQRTEEYWWDGDVGNLLVYGTDASATSAVVATLTIGLARFDRRRPPHVYIIDFTGGGGLTMLGRLPHVGAVVTAGDDERLVRVIDHLEAELAARGERAREAGKGRLGPDDGESLMLLAVANYGGLTGFLEEANLYELASRLERIGRDGPALGIHLVATANHDRAVPTRLASQIESKLVMRLADATAYTTFGLRAKDVPDLGWGRAIDVRTGHEVQIASYSSGGADRNPGPGTEPAEPADRPRGIDVLGTDLDPMPLVSRSGASGNGFSLTIGQRYDDLGPATVQLRPDTHLLVAGPSGSGRTTALLALAMAAGHADRRCRVLVVADDPDPWSGPAAPAELLSPSDDLDRLDELGDEPALVLVDGITALTEAGARRLDELQQGRVWVVLADRPERLQTGPTWLRRYQASRSGLLLQPQPDHGDLFRVRLPLRTSRVWPAGRGYLVEAGTTDLIQVVNPHLSTAAGSGTAGPSAEIGRSTLD